MSSPGPFSLYVPADARRPFETDESTRRFGEIAKLVNGSFVLELGCGRANASCLLAKDVGCKVIAAGSDEASLEGLRGRVKAMGIKDRIEVAKVDYDALTMPEGAFDAILVQGSVIWPLPKALRTLRKHLIPMKGRIGLTYVAKVGRYPAPAATRYWEDRLGEPLRAPKDLLQVLEDSGFEPETVETLSDEQLAEHYYLAEQKLGTDQNPMAQILKEEIALFRSTSGKASVSYAWMVGRRKEPGEKPPPSRDRG